MADRIWIGGTSAVPTLAANWDPAAAPIEGDVLIWNDQATQGTDGADLGAIGVSVIVEETFAGSGFTIGSSGTPLQANNFPYFEFKGDTVGKSAFYADTTVFTVAIVDSKSTQDDVVELQGEVTKLTIRRGKVKLHSGATITAATGRIEVASAGNSPAELTIPAGVTLTNSVLALDGGKVFDSAGAPTVNISDGDYQLLSTAGIATRLEQRGGEFIWNNTGASTIALAEIRGGMFRTKTIRIGRTMTNMNVYGDAMVDFSIGGHVVTFTNPPRVYGTNPIRWPRGATVTRGI